MIEMHQAYVDQDRLSGDVEKQNLDSTAPTHQDKTSTNLLSLTERRHRVNHVSFTHLFLPAQSPNLAACASDLCPVCCGSLCLPTYTASLCQVPRPFSGQGKAALESAAAAATDHAFQTTYFYGMYHAYKGGLHLDVWKCHEKYGMLLLDYHPSRSFLLIVLMRCRPLRPLCS